MSNLCAEIAKDLVTSYNAGTIFPINIWIEQFKECKDFPREPETFGSIIEAKVGTDLLMIRIPSCFKARKFQATFTEIIE